MHLPLLIAALRSLLETRAIDVDDHAVARVADAIVAAIPGQLKRFVKYGVSLDSARGFNHNTWGFTLPDRLQVARVDGVPVSVEIHVNASEEWDRVHRQYVKGGALRTVVTVDSQGRPVGKSIPISIRVTLNSLATPQELIDAAPKQLRKEVVSVLRHEITHLRDSLKPVRMRGADPGDFGTANAKSPRDYYNDPSEVRAFMRQVVDEVLDYARELRADPDSFIPDVPTRHFVDDAVHLSKTWQRISPHLEPANSRLILQAVSRGLSDHWHEIQRPLIWGPVSPTAKASRVDQATAIALSDMIDEVLYHEDPVVKGKALELLRQYDIPMEDGYVKLGGFSNMAQPAAKKLLGLIKQLAKTAS